MWSIINEQEFEKFKRLRQIGFLDVVEIPQHIPEDDPRWEEIIKILGVNNEDNH